MLDNKPFIADWGTAPCVSSKTEHDEGSFLLFWKTCFRIHAVTGEYLVDMDRASATTQNPARPWNKQGCIHAYNLAMFPL
jgi:hypothetical protein